jgi:hypothetical protein
MIAGIRIDLRISNSGDGNFKISGLRSSGITTGGTGMIMSGTIMSSRRTGCGYEAAIAGMWSLTG